MQDPTFVAQTGWTAADLQAEINAQSFFDPFSLVTLQIGVNDQYQGLPLAEYEITLESVVDPGHSARRRQPRPGNRGLHPRLVGYAICQRPASGTAAPGD